MAQKNENEKTPVDAKSATETEVTPVKPEPETDLDKQKVEQSEQPAKSAKNGRSATGDLSPELIELVTELRDTVKRIDPRKHTEKTLRRVLFNISDILKDIEALYTKS